MIYSSVEELSKKGHNRYVLCIATSKCARKITEESYEQNSVPKESTPSSKKAICDEKPVSTAIKQMYSHRFEIVTKEENS